MFHVISMDTGAEHPETYKFMRKFNEYLVCVFWCVGDISSR